MQNELIVVKEVNPLEVFTGEGLDEILDRVEKEVSSLVPDMGSQKGRKAIASMAHKVAKSKVSLDNIGKALVSDWKAKTKVVDINRKKARDRLDKIRDDVREPLTIFENAEKDRIGAHNGSLEEIQRLADKVVTDYAYMPPEAIADVSIAVLAFANRDWQEFKKQAAIAIDSADKVITEALQQKSKDIALELERFTREKEEAAERQIAREKKIADDAAAQATANTEARIKKQHQAFDRSQNVTQLPKRQAYSEEMQTHNGNEDNGTMSDAELLRDYSNRIINLARNALPGMSTEAGKVVGDGIGKALISLQNRINASIEGMEQQL